MHDAPDGAGRPRWDHALVVVAHPDDESFGLGAVLSDLTGAGTRVTVLCLTRGEASTLHGVPGDLTELRAAELASAGQALGVAEVILRDLPDGGLADLNLDTLVDEVAPLAATADGLLTFDLTGVTGHPDHVRVAEATLAAAEPLGLPVLAWTLPVEVTRALEDELGVALQGHEPHEVDVVLDVDRTRQRQAIACHTSQAVPGSILWRRLELLGDTEHLRWLAEPDSPT